MNKSTYIRSSELLDKSKSQLLIVDVQEKLVPVMRDHERLIDRCRRLAIAAQIFEIPITITEQYPKGLGKTVSELQEFDESPKEKTRFSSAEIIEWPLAAENPNGRNQIILAGIEAHVCILQTALDLIAQGYSVFIAADAVSSRNEDDAKIGFDRMTLGGCTLTTSESVLFEWCETASAKEFKAISKLVK